MRGDRYAEGLDAGIVETIRRDLPYYSFGRACGWYQRYVPQLSPEYLRFLAAVDRFFLLTWVLERKDAIVSWIYDRAREVDLDPDNHLDLWARYHYKSTLITFAGTLQEIINDPDITVAIFSNTARIARPFLNQLKEECERNERLKGMYPEIFWADPKHEAPTWSTEKGIVVKRISNPKELTVSAFGLVDGLPTGGHWQLLIFDDIVTQDSVTQTDTDQVKKTWLAWEQAQNLGTHQHLRRWHVGTRYHYGDAYATMLDGGMLKKRIHPATHDGTLNGRPVLLSDEKWAQIKRDQRLTVAAQQLLNPLAGEENLFLVDWLRPYALRPNALTVWILIDPAGNKPGVVKSDRTAIMVVGMDSARNLYLLDGFCHRMKLSERTDKYLELNEKWRTAAGVQMVRTGYERFGAQTDVEHIELEATRRKQEGVSIEEVNWPRQGPASKTARISRLEPDFRNSRFWLPPYVHLPKLGQCTWQVNVKTEPRMLGGEPVKDKVSGKAIYDVIPGSAEILYTPYRGQSRAERDVERDGESYRIMKPLRRLDGDGNVYDLTRLVFEEYRLAPFAAHDDALDALSRIYDVDPVPPTVVERVDTREAEGWPDA